MFSAEYFKTLLFSYVPVCSSLASRTCYAGSAHNPTIVGVCKSPLLRRKYHLKGPPCALLPQQLFICLQTPDQNFFPPSLLLFSCTLHWHQ